MIPALATLAAFGLFIVIARAVLRRYDGSHEAPRIRRRHSPAAIARRSWARIHPGPPYPRRRPGWMLRRPLRPEDAATVRWVRALRGRPGHTAVLLRGQLAIARRLIAAAQPGPEPDPQPQPPPVPQPQPPPVPEPRTPPDDDPAGPTAYEHSTAWFGAIDADLPEQVA